MEIRVKLNAAIWVEVYSQKCCVNGQYIIVPFPLKPEFIDEYRDQVFKYYSSSKYHNGIYEGRISYVRIKEIIPTTNDLTEWIDPIYK